MTGAAPMMDQRVLSGRSCDEERRRIGLALRGALDAGEFSLVYQPVVEIGSWRIAGFEALLRWTSHTLGQVPPGIFVPVAEEEGLLLGIGDWVLRSACAEAAAWPEELLVAVNVSPRQFGDPAFPVLLASALAQTGIAPDRLELETTACLFRESPAEARAALGRIRGLGIRLALDDFAPSALNLARGFRFDTVKVDCGLLERASRDGAARSVALARSLGTTLIAKGVADPGQIGAARALGCDQAQGYILSRPVSASSARALVAERRTRAA